MNLLPKLTVLIPTIERPDTLYWTIKTVIAQQYNNLDIIISDNYSNDNTREVVDSFIRIDKRIKYIKTSERLSMSHHWEFALEHINDGYVTILGDDDGILPNALERVGAIINKHHPEAVGWRFGNFNWKGLPPYFLVPMACWYRIVDSKKEVNKIFSKSIYNTIQFPSLYGGFIDIKLIKKLKQNFGSNFFHSRIPDFFSGALVAASVKNYIRLEFPITINATSKHSTGYATLSSTNDQKAYESLVSNSDSNIPFHPKLIFIRSNAVPIAEAMLQVHELVPTFPVVDIKAMLVNVAKEAASDSDQNKYAILMDGVKKIARINELIEFGDKLISDNPQNPVGNSIKKKYSIISNTLYMDTTGTDVENVFDACSAANSFIPKKTLHLQKSILQKFSSLYSAIKFTSIKLKSKYKHCF